MESALPAAGFLYWVGAGTVAYVALRISCSLLTALRVWGLGHDEGVGPRLGEWAVVTGSTDGIGKSYAEELAKRGMKIVLISRSQDKLNQVSSEIREKFKVETKTIAVDFESEDIYDKIKTSLAGLQIGVLVNNVGMSYQYPEYFLEIPDLDNTIKKLININVLSVCKMTRLVLPGMVERSKGAIINISSASGLYPFPLLTIYSATKAFVDFFSQSLHEEYKSKGIIVQAKLCLTLSKGKIISDLTGWLVGPSTRFLLCAPYQLAVNAEQSVLPYFVATKLANIRRPTWDKPSPEVFVKSAIKTVGVQSRTNGYLIHSLMASVISSLPSWLYFKMAMNIGTSMRARYLKKNKKN